MSDPVRLSVVIPTYQRRDSLRRTLAALVSQTTAPESYEVIVVIDGSDDGTREMVAAFAAPYRLEAVWQPNAGRAAARNAGIARARGDVVVFLDDDMEPVSGFVSAHLDAHPQGSRRAVVGPVPIPMNPLDPPIVEYRRQGMHTLLNRLAEPGYRLGFRDVYTGNLSVRREVLLEVGAFDPAFTVYGHEDYEIALRLLKAGVELAFCPAAVAHQRYEKDLPAMARDCIARGQSAVLFARKHPDAAAGLRLAGYREGSRKWRLLRSVLLGATDVYSGFPDRIVQLIAALERRRPRRLHAYYTLAVDYFFWVGARSALADGAPAGQAGRLPVAMRLVLVLLVLFSLASSARLLLRAASAGVASGAEPDAISRYELRFQELRAMLPRGTELGYIGGAPAGDAAAEGNPERRAFERELLAQYALLPATLRPGADAELVVGDFEYAAAVDSAAISGLVLIRDFGNGVMLFRARRP